MARMEADSYLKDRNLRQSRRRWFFRGSAGVLILGLLGIGAVWMMLNASFFTVRHFEVSGNQTTPTEKIRTFLDTRVLTASLSSTLLGFQNIIAWSEQSFDNHAPELPRVKSIAIQKSYASHTVRVLVTERVPFGIWCSLAKSADPSPAETSSTVPSAPPSAPSCFWFDRDGVLLDQAPQASGNLIAVVHDYSGKYLRSQTKVHESRAIANLISVFDAIAAANLPVREVRLENRDLEELTVRLVNGPDLYFSLRFPADETPSVIRALRAGAGTKNPAFSSLQYVDFRVEHRASYK